MQKKRRYTKKQMYALIRKWESSGLSQEQFFRRHRIAKSTFGYWRKKYIKEKVNSKSKENFIPVETEKTGNTYKNTEVLELVYPNGVRLVCSEGMELSRLKPLIVL